MTSYLLRRLLLIPLTLFCIILVNFVVLNLAPGDPLSITEISAEGGAVRREQASTPGSQDDRYLYFRQFYGLTLPVLFNSWPWISREQVTLQLWQISYKRLSRDSTEEMDFADYQTLRTKMGDQARFVMPHLLALLSDPNQPLPLRQNAMRFFVRGGSGFAELGPTLTSEQKQHNQFVEQQNLFLRNQLPTPGESPEELQAKIDRLQDWYLQYRQLYQFEPTGSELFTTFFTKTRFWRYMSRVVTLDFGTMRNDSNRRVIDEVTKRFKYSLTLSLLPMAATFVLCQLFGMAMATHHGRPLDYGLNLLFLLLYATPVFVVAPWLIENVAFNGHFFGTNYPIPLGGFTSPEAQFAQMTSWERVIDIAAHIALPLLAILYGSLAAQSRLSRTALLEVLRCDYVRTARAKGVPPGQLLFKHVGRNAAITIITSLSGSLGLILGGSLIVETLFQIDGFGKFFYDAILNRDYNVVMFSALAGSFLSLAGYLAADLSYAFLDPRITLD